MFLYANNLKQRRSNNKSLCTWMRPFSPRTFFFACLFCATCVFGAELYDDKPVSRIDILIDAPGENSVDPAPILSRMKTQKGDRFSQVTFDNDLKALAEEYDTVEPTLQVKDDRVYIEIRVVPRPVIHHIEWSGNEQFRTSTLQDELGVKPNTVFNRQSFNKAFNKIKEYYFKKGYFESQISYSIQPVPESNEVDILISVYEGHSGYIKKIIFSGFTADEQSALEEQMYLKKYNFLTSWMSGTGVYRDDALEQDKMTLINYLQNEGYADARVEITHEEDPKSGKLIIEIRADKGQLYRFGSISFDGNTLLSTDELLQKVAVKEEGTFSPDKMRESAQAIKDLYGQKGYIDTNVQFETRLREEEPVFDLEYVIEEGQSYKIGIIHIFGNSSTKNNVILRESLLVPGETFDSRKLKATQQRLEGMGYFKTVNVYAVRSDTEEGDGDNYRDVYIEVEETTTGNISLFMGFSSVDDISGGIDLTERNFRIGGFGKALLGQLSQLRGGGEYFHVRGTIGRKQSNILVSWMNPYVNDTLWRLGVELSQTYSNDLQDDVNVKTYGGSVYANYPLSAYWTVGVRERLRHSYDHLTLDPLDHSPIAEASVREQRELVDQRGLISAVSGNISYDSTDSPAKPHRGWRSYAEAEVAGVGGNYQFFKTSYLNTIYFPVWKKGTLKLRADVKYMIPFGKTDRESVPYSERFFLGGDNTVRGYKPFILGPVIYLKNSLGQSLPTDTPKGGLSSCLVSLEYNQEIIRMLDVFAFFDVGSVSFQSFASTHIRPTTGVGVRVDLGNRAPILVGWGIPLVKQDRNKRKWQKVFFSMGGQF